MFGSEDYNDLVDAGFPTDVFGIFVNVIIPRARVRHVAADLRVEHQLRRPDVRSGRRTSARPNCGLFRDDPPFSGMIDSEVDGVDDQIQLSCDPGRYRTANAPELGVADDLDCFSDSALLLSGRRRGVAAVPEPSS